MPARREPPAPAIRSMGEGCIIPREYRCDVRRTRVVGMMHGSEKGEPIVRIVVIEDDLGLRRMISTLLADEGFAVIEWPTGAGAHALIRRERPDVVLLDFRLEERRAGLAVLDAIRDDPQTRETAVIACSGDIHFLREQGAMLRALQCGIIEKPFDIAELLALIHLSAGTRPARDRVACA